MDNGLITLDQVLALARKLTPLEKVHLIEKVIPDLEVSLAAAEPKHPVGGTLGELISSPLCGLWADRTDIEDSMAYARQLRAQAEQRNHE
ncbi:MAG: hypothetical protein HYW07_00655 [Candidatus Latescibacteria bacterium]|nr:hypothetical protein [Candidatus Latescibacterota bacterium]